jgi:CheY-like chemotaxis protein
MPRVRVLVVEDDDDSAEVVGEALKQLGHEVRSVRDGSLALTEARHFEPDVVLLDLGLPSMDGVEVARHLRGSTSRIRIVAVTGRGPAAASGADFDGYLVKPVTLETLSAALTPSAA